MGTIESLVLVSFLGVDELEKIVDESIAKL
jgi:hypothetical protein